MLISRALFHIDFDAWFCTVGLMVDVVRHFIPMKLLRRTVDGMAAAKLNVLHMHLTDSQVGKIEF